MVMTFSLPIFVNLKDRLWLAIIEESLLIKRPLADLEFDIANLTAPSNCWREKVETILDFVDENRLACAAWAKI